MNKIGRITLSVLSGSVLTVAAWALPPRAANGAPNSAAAQSKVELQSASGTIAAVQSDSFTLQTGSSTSRGQGFLPDNAPKTMMFLIDNNTTLDGKLTVGASASVIYREENGNNVAVNVNVSK